MGPILSNGCDSSGAGIRVVAVGLQWGPFSRMGVTVVTEVARVEQTAASMGPILSNGCDPGTLVASSIRYSLQWGPFSRMGVTQYRH